MKCHINSNVNSSFTSLFIAAANLDIPPGVSEIFQAAVFWPKKPENSSKKKRTKEKIPVAATSEEWIHFMKSKEAAEADDEAQLAERKEKRKRVAEEKKKLGGEEESHSAKEKSRQKDELKEIETKLVLETGPKQNSGLKFVYCKFSHIIAK